MKVVKELEPIRTCGEIHPNRRLVILQRDDGHFAVAEEYYFVSELDGKIIKEGWQRLPPDGFYATAEIAEREGEIALKHRLRLAGRGNSE